MKTKTPSPSTAPETHRDAIQARPSTKIKSGIRAGAIDPNHNETQVRPSIRIKSGIKAGALDPNHNETLLRNR